MDHKKERGLLEYQYNADAFEDVGEILRPFLVRINLIDVIM